MTSLTSRKDKLLQQLNIEQVDKKFWDTIDYERKLFEINKRKHESSQWPSKQT
jgi:hypothetical protein